MVKSSNPARMAQNLQAVDWQLPPEAYARLSQLEHQGKYEIGDWAVGPDKPFKTVEELWDGEVAGRHV